MFHLQKAHLGDINVCDNDRNKNSLKKNKYIYNYNYKGMSQESLGCAKGFYSRSKVYSEVQLREIHTITRF